MVYQNGTLVAMCSTSSPSTAVEAQLGALGLGNGCQAFRSCLVGAYDELMYFGYTLNAVISRSLAD